MPAGRRALRRAPPGAARKRDRRADQCALRWTRATRTPRPGCRSRLLGRGGRQRWPKRCAPRWRRQGFVGTAAVLLNISECPAAPERNSDLGAGLRISDLGALGTTEALVFDDARSDQIVESGAFETYADPPDVIGRVYSRPAGRATPAATAVCITGWSALRRYILTADLVLDSNYIGERPIDRGAVPGLRAARPAVRIDLRHAGAGQRRRRGGVRVRADPTGTSRRARRFVPAQRDTRTGRT